MKKTVLATIAIWGLGISSAAALVNTLAKPPVPKQVAEAAPPPPAETAPIDLDQFKVPRPSIVSAPVKALRAQLQVPVKAVPKRDMKCTEFRSMQFGPVDHGVRYCK
jgi:hypothetical protein